MLVAVVAVVTAALLFVGDRRAVEALGATRPAPVLADPGIVPVAADSEVPTEAGMSATLAAPLADPNLGILTGRISDAMTGSSSGSRATTCPCSPPRRTRC